MEIALIFVVNRKRKNLRIGIFRKCSKRCCMGHWNWKMSQKFYDKAEENIREHSCSMVLHYMYKSRIYIFTMSYWFDTDKWDYCLIKEGIDFSRELASCSGKDRQETFNKFMYYFCNNVDLDDMVGFLDYVDVDDKSDTTYIRGIED